MKGFFSRQGVAVCLDDALPNIPAADHSSYAADKGLVKGGTMSRKGQGG